MSFFSSKEKPPSQYEKEVILQKEVEKIEIISTKLKEKYKNFQELVVFIEAKVKNWNDEQIKEQLINKEIYIMSLDTGVDEKVFNDIYDNFQSLYTSIGEIYAVTEKLLEKHKECGECQQFINYLRDVCLIFVEVQKEGLNIGQARDRLFKARMKVLSIDGNPELGVLEKIYDEFRKELGVKKE